jgi:hypothetical protein
MPDEEKAFGRSLKDRLTILGFRAPWSLIMAAMRLLYGFTSEGFENVPEDGPFISLVIEPSLIGVFVAGWNGIEILLKVNLPKQIKSMGYMQDQLFAISYFRSLQDMEGPSKSGALIPHSAGRMALSLVDGYRALRDGGTVSINPEGDGPWDGRPYETRSGAAWLGLHTGAQLIAHVCSLGAYDIWPRWARLPYLRGKLSLKTGEPFTLTDRPVVRATHEELTRATARIRTELDSLRYGPGGVAEWAGPPTRAGEPVEAPADMRPPGPVVPPADTSFREVAVSRRGVAQLLWRCPICRTNDALLHRRRLLQREGLRCLACGTAWEVRRIPEHDFRLEVTEGAPDLIGLEMALTAWYDHMKRDFEPNPIPTQSVSLLPGEHVVLVASDTGMMPHQPSPLFGEAWSGPEAPLDQESDSPHLGEWDTIGTGRLILTDQRMVWQGADRELHFHWSRVTAVYLWLRNTLGLLYGTARYRIKLGREVGLKWLTYAGTLAQRAERDTGYPLTLSPF